WAAQLVSKSVKKFRNDWMKLPRARSEAGKTRRSVWREFSENMTEHLIWESGRALRCGEFRQAMRNLMILPRFHPLTVMRIVRHRLLRVPRGGSSGSLSTFGIQV
ncbi:MAG TPA: hypothetical protein VK475_13335, partial [Pyrinomonadaceae bacterium]|nr:hypothetical protein [Pyrinomonadaceae bacterium]